MTNVSNRPERLLIDHSRSIWQVIEDLLADQRKRKYELRQIFNAIFYVVKGGIPWRLMPKDLPPWKSIYYYLLY
jgi:putative transposase